MREIEVDMRQWDGVVVASEGKLKLTMRQWDGVVVASGIIGIRSGSQSQGKEPPIVNK
jgi:hypothetical protein